VDGPRRSASVRTSPSYPQSNGKLERWHGTLKNERFRDKAPRNVEEARRVVADFVTHYNEVRLRSALGYVTPVDKLAGRDTEILAATASSRPLARSDSDEVVEATEHAGEVSSVSQGRSRRGRWTEEQADRRGVGMHSPNRRNIVKSVRGCRHPGIERDAPRSGACGQWPRLLV